MSAEVFRAGQFVSQPKRGDDEPKGFNQTCSVTEGARQPSRVRPVDQPQMGNIHRSSVKEFVQHDTDHLPYSSAHRPEEPNDLGQLKANQASMLTSRGKRKRRGG